jgi:hypothetical protein
MFWLTVDAGTKEWNKTQIKDLHIGIFHTLLKDEESKRHEQGNQKCVTIRNKDISLAVIIAGRWSNSRLVT